MMALSAFCLPIPFSSPPPRYALEYCLPLCVDAHKNCPLLLPLALPFAFDGFCLHNEFRQMLLHSIQPCNLKTQS